MNTATRLRRQNKTPEIANKTDREEAGAAAAAKGKNRSTARADRGISGRIVWPVLVLYHVALLVFVIRRCSTYPSAKLIISSELSSFTEERARRHLETLAGFGQRTVGSFPNEDLAKGYILDELYKIRKACGESHVVDVDVQTVSGVFSLYLKSQFHTVYLNVRNIVARIDPAGSNGTENSLLVNCHYDSVVESPGAGDDAVSCSIMLEVLRAFSQRNQPLKHSIIFLFNGAEENILQASHGFITQHLWANSIRAFVNLDSAGAAGWELVFQAGPEHPWLIRAYVESVKYPFASVLGQEIFQSGVVPSDTDYRIFRDFGHIPGLDIAYIANGYVYHTSNDKPEFIPPGCIQRGGENLLSLLESLAMKPQLSDPGSDRHGEMVFFDYLGYFMIAYPKRIATVLNSAVIMIVVISLIRKGHRQIGGGAGWYFYHLGKAMFGLLLMWTLEVLGVVSVAGLLITIGKPMTWFNHDLNMVWIFVTPGLLISFAVLKILKDFFFKNIHLLTLNSIFVDGNLALWTSLLSYLTYLNIGSAFPIVIWIVMILIYKMCVGFLQFFFEGNSVLILTVHLAALLIPTAMTIYLAHSCLLLFLPILGRIGTFVIPDLIVASMVALLIVFFTGFHAGLVLISKNLKMVLVFLALVFITGIFLVSFTPLGFPYSLDPNRPAFQRQIIKHFTRKFHDKTGKVLKSDSGIWCIPLDYYGLREMQATTLANALPAKCDGPYCGWPYYYPMLKIIDIKESMYVPGPPLDDNLGVKLELVKREMYRPQELRLTFRLIGPDHMTGFISPRPKVDLVEWSLGEGHPTPAAVPHYVDQDVYFIYYSHAVPPIDPWQFSINLLVSKDVDLNSTIVDIAFAGHYLHGDHKITPQLKDFLSKLPVWITPVSWSATYDCWEY